jgi:hypothetical protein
MSEAAVATTPQASTANAPVTPAAAPTTPEAKKYKVNVYGQEREVDEATLLRNYQKGEAADERFRQASEKEKLATSFIEDLQKDPWAAFKKLGKNPEQEAENLLIKKLQYENMSPAEKRALEAEKRAEDAEYKIKMQEAQSKAEQERIAKEYQEQLTLQAVQEIDQEISDALKATGVKPTPKIIQNMAEVMIAHLEARDGKKIDAGKAYEKTTSEIFEFLGELLPQMKTEDILAKLPKSALDAIRKGLLDQVTSQSPVRKTSSRGMQVAAAKRVTKTSTDDFFNKLESKFK